MRLGGDLREFLRAVEAGEGLGRGDVEEDRAVVGARPSAVRSPLPSCPSSKPTTVLPQAWPAATARNAAGLLSALGRSRTAALLLICADAAPGAAAVGPEIARFSGRAPYCSS